MGHDIIASIFNLNGPGTYVHWHWIQLSLANLIVIAAMVLVFILAIVVPFSHRSERTVTGDVPEGSLAEHDAEAQTLEEVGPQ